MLKYKEKTTPCKGKWTWLSEIYKTNIFTNWIRLKYLIILQEKLRVIVLRVALHTKNL
jgi:hypothetical protein